MGFDVKASKLAEKDLSDVKTYCQKSNMPSFGKRQLEDGPICIRNFADEVSAVQEQTAVVDLAVFLLSRVKAFF